jgi:septal ring factor EnvC (AmiA/AmiB activator)
MISARRGLLLVLILAPLGLWGCAQERNGAANSKIRDLAARNGKLEEDVRLAGTATDGLRRKLAQAETQRADLAKQVALLEGAVRERDELRRHLESRTGERDNLHGQLVQFARELQSLTDRIEAVTNNNSVRASGTSSVP